MSDVDEIKARLDIAEVIGGYIKLEKAGKNLRANCPFHNEKTPSFHVSPDRQRYHCFGCSAGGDIFTFVEEFEGLDFQGALKLLADRAGVTLSYTPGKNKKEGEDLYMLMEEAARVYEKNLMNTTEAREYLKKRGVTEKTMKSFRLGYASDEWRFLKNEMNTLGIEDEKLLEAGLIKETEKAGKDGKKKRYDRFRDRIIFPIFDTAGRVIAFSGRILHEREKAPKYLNSPETPLFNKSQVIYGLDRAKGSIRKNNFSILVEGQMDIVLSHQAGYSNTVASSGTSITAHHLKALSRLSQNIVLAFDSDSAGRSSLIRTSEVALTMGMDVKVADLPPGSDPADMIREGKDAWKRIIRSSKHVIDYLLSKCSEESSDERAFLRSTKEIVLPLLSVMSDKIDREHFIREVERATDLSDSLIREEIRSITSEKMSEPSRKPVTALGEKKQKHSPQRKHSIERYIIGIIEWQNKGGGDMEDGVYIEKLEKLTGEAYATILGAHDRDALIFEVERLFSRSTSLKEDLHLLLLHLEEEILKEELESVNKKLSESEKSRDEDKSVEYLRRVQEIALNIAKIRDEIQQEFHVI